MRYCANIVSSSVKPWRSSHRWRVGQRTFPGISDNWRLPTISRSALVSGAPIAPSRSIASLESKQVIADQFCLSDSWDLQLQGQMLVEEHALIGKVTVIPDFSQCLESSLPIDGSVKGEEVFISLPMVVCHMCSDQMVFQCQDVLPNIMTSHMGMAKIITDAHMPAVERLYQGAKFISFMYLILLIEILKCQAYSRFFA